MSKKKGPTITTSKDNFTCVTFYPDLKRFKLKNLSRDFVNLLYKRVGFD